MQRVGRTDFDLLLHRLCRIEPVLDIVRIGELQPEKVFLDEVQRVENLFVEFIGERFFLLKKKQTK